MKNIIEYQGKNVSWVKNLNLLCKERNIYVMDNHNAALWCWLQEIDLNQKYNLLHIDRHYDTRKSHINEWIEHIPNNLQDLSVHDYLSLNYKDPNFGNPIEIMRWDNYLSIFHRLFNNNVKKYHFFTHKEGSLFDEMESKIDEHPIYGLFNLMDYLFDKENTGNYPWIVNIDLDYFFDKIDDTDISFRLFSLTAIDFFLQKIKENLSDKIAVLTIALSPECCGNWENSIELMNHFAQKLNIEFKMN